MVTYLTCCNMSAEVNAVKDVDKKKKMGDQKETCT